MDQADSCRQQSVESAKIWQPTVVSVVATLEDLACLDLIVWLRTGANAAKRLGISQPKVSRAVQTVTERFGISIKKKEGEWEILGDQYLLNLERNVHQEYRWLKDLPLRVEAQYYSGPLYCTPAPIDWLPGNFDFVEIHTPLHHLRTGVIDAWIGCYPDTPEDDDPELTCFHLTRLPTHLVVSPDHPLLKKKDTITLEEVSHYPSLALKDNAFPKIQAALTALKLWNFTQTLNRYEHIKWEGLVSSDLAIGYATALSIGLFQHPKVILPLEIPLEVGESLVVKRRYANHPRLQVLLEHLQRRARDLARRFPEIRLLEGSSLE